MLLSIVQKVVLDAGRLFAEKIESTEINTKMGTANYVTSIDLAVQEFILEKLVKILPESNIITEEAERNIFDLSKPTWILDPVDGTTNIMYDYKHSAISLALIVDKKPLIGIVYNPFLMEMFYAEENKGAYVNKQRISVSKNKLLEQSLICFGTTPYDRSKADKTFETARRVFDNCRDIRRSGAASLDLAYVASGRVDGFYELTLQPWDYAAGLIIIKEAGGEITNWSGDCLDYLKPEGVVASNGFIHKELINVLNI